MRVGPGATLVCAAGVAFALSRVSWVARVVNLMIVVASGYLGYLHTGKGVAGAAWTA